MKQVEYFFTPVSPWAYFGHWRFCALAAKHGAMIVPKLVDLGKVFPVSGGLPLAKRAPQRQAYRLVELARWRDALGMPINLQPKFIASSGDLATCWFLAAHERDATRALDFAGAVMRARFAEDGDIADVATLASLARASGFDPGALAPRAAEPDIAAIYQATTQEAIERGVFGVPWYVYRDQPFWGQDRLDFLDRALAQ